MSVALAAVAVAALLALYFVVMFAWSFLTDPSYGPHCGQHTVYVCDE
jgi:hypothetical protein